MVRAVASNNSPWGSAGVEDREYGEHVVVPVEPPEGVGQLLDALSAAGSVTLCCTPRVNV